MPDVEIDETIRALKQIKKGKASGEDGIIIEMFQRRGFSRTGFFLNSALLKVKFQKIPIL